MYKDYLYYKELYHHQIKGAKWGHRRFQNEDGSLTPEGRERYRKVSESVKSGIGKSINVISKSEKPLTETSKELMNISKNIKTKPGKYVQKDYSNITDQDLQKRVNRLNLERQYGQLTGDTKYIASGSEKARELLQTIGSMVAIGASAASIIGTFYAIKTAKGK